MLNILFHSCVFMLDGEKKISLSDYNKLLDKFKTLNSRTQQLELNEYKRNNPGYISLLNNATTAYKLIDDMFKFKPDATWNELFDSDKPVDNVCMKTKVKKLNRTFHRDDWGPAHHETIYTFECAESLPFEQSNIKGYVEYKHAYNTNDKQWLKQVIQQIIDENKDFHFEDVVNEFRKKYHRIYEDDKRLYKHINI